MGRVPPRMALASSFGHAHRVEATVPSENLQIESALDAIGRAPFALADVLRRSRGDAAAAFGLGPSECPYRVIGSGPHWRLRDYGGASPAVLIVAAPIKRPYIWDLAPSASAIRWCLDEGLHVHLLEWLPASRDDGDVGLDDSLVAIADCVSRIGGPDGAGRPVLIGHSLGGTLAAIYAASSPDSIDGLVLLCAPLCFAPQTSEFRDALVSLVPPVLSETEPFPGSLLSHMSALASPQAFVWGRLMDAALNFADGHAMEIHARIERWALDEVTLPGKLVRQIIEDLYRDNRLFRGELAVRGTLVGPANLTVPTLAVVNINDDVAPPTAIEPFVAAMPLGGGRIIRYPGEPGVGLQHLGILVGRKARAEIWPQIVAWMRASGQRSG